MNVSYTSTTPQPGDIVKVNRGLYTHYGVYVGDGKIVHFSATGPNEMDPATADICETSTTAFAAGGNIVVDDHSVPRFSRQEIVARARGRIGQELGNYNLVSWNCEHFARWCVTGEMRSRQVNQVKNAIENTMKIISAYEKKGPEAALLEFVNRKREPERS